MKNDPRSCEPNCSMQLRKKPEKKNQDFNGIWTSDLAIPVRRSNQLSYEATDSPIVCHPPPLDVFFYYYYFV